jgi:hypothetical protein
MVKGGEEMKKWLLAMFVLLLLSIGAACSKERSENAQEPVPEQETEDHIAKIGIQFPYTAPLTGIGSNTPYDPRITMVIIENHPQARPQSGLNKADMVYEVLAEGGITRFAAFYQSEHPENVGPVRSIRTYFIRLAEGFDALLVHAGWSPEAQSIITKEKKPSVNGLFWDNKPQYFWRDKSRKAPHNMYTNFEYIKEVANRLKYNEEGKIPQFLFKDKSEEMTGNPAADITIKYNASYKVGYTYDSGSKLYQRSINEKPHTDLITGETLTATNLLVIETKHKVLDSEGRLSIDLASGGNGYLFQRGKVIDVTWKNVDGVIQAFKDGEQMKLYPGKTWVNIVQDLNGVSYQ